MAGTPLTEPSGRPSVYRSDLVFHSISFLFINGLMWLLDLAVGTSGIQWAYWVTFGWGIGLLAHVLAYFVYGGPTD